MHVKDIEYPQAKRWRATRMLSHALELNMRSNCMQQAT